MKLYLVQHGLAVDKNLDPSRPLSEEGILEVTAMASWLQKAHTRTETIYHSGKARAQQTAEIFADKLDAATVQTLQGIQPNDDVLAMTQFIDGLVNNTMIVGHLPFMQRMVSRLLTDNDEMACHYLPGSVVCLQNDSGWSLDWMLRPDLIIE